MLRSVFEMLGYSAQNPPKLTLRPDSSAHALHGFHSGNGIQLHADFFGQTIGAILEKFNTYRGPDQQIKRVWDLHTQKEVNLSDPLTIDRTVLIRLQSI